jgi:hypothetical protein
MSGPCARCGRTVTLRGRAPEGPICSNCCAQRKSGTCAYCSEHRRLDGRDPEGHPWCARCRDRQRRSDAEADWRRQVLEAVAAIESLAPETIASVVDRAVSSARAMRWLANHLAEHPDALMVGPTNSPPVLDRLVRELVGAGAAGPRHLPQMRQLRSPGSAPRPRWQRLAVPGVLGETVRTSLCGVRPDPQGVPPRRQATTCPRRLCRTGQATSRARRSDPPDRGGHASSRAPARRPNDQPGRRTSRTGHPTVPSARPRR